MGRKVTTQEDQKNSKNPRHYKHTQSSSRSILRARTIYNRVNPHIHTRHPRHRVHIRARALAMCLILPVTGSRAAHTARVAVVVGRVLLWVQTICCVGPCAVRVGTDRGRATIGGAPGIFSIYVFARRQTLHADSTVITVGIRGWKPLLDTLTTGPSTGMAL